MSWLQREKRALTVSQLTLIEEVLPLISLSVVDGEYVREDLRESQEGIPVYLDLQLVDVNTCDPVSDVYIDIWSCNATGVYAGGKCIPLSYG